MAFGGGGKQEIMSEINVTPLCDIFVVLLIIMMATADKITAKGPEVDLPAMQDEVKNDAQVGVTLTKDKQVYVNSVKVSMQDLPKVLADKLKDPSLPNKHVIFCGDKGVLMKDVGAVMIQCHDAIVAAGDQNPQVSIKTAVKKE